MKVLLTAMLVCMATVGYAQQQDKLKIIQTWDHRGVIGYRMLIDEEIKALKVELAAERKVFSQAMGNAQKAWAAYGRKDSFPRSKIMARKYKPLSKVFKDLQKATDYITGLEAKIVLPEQLEKKISEADKKKLTDGKKDKAKLKGEKKWVANTKKRMKENILRDIALKYFKYELYKLTPSEDDDITKSSKKAELKLKKEPEKGKEPEKDPKEIEAKYSYFLADSDFPYLPPSSREGNIATTAKAVASSEGWPDNKTTYIAENVIDGMADGHSLTEWRSETEGEVAWVQLGWSGNIKTDRIILFRSKNQRAKGVIITFSDGTFIETGELPHKPYGGLEVRFKAKSTKTIKIQLSKEFESEHHFGLAEVAVFRAR